MYPERTFDYTPKINLRYCAIAILIFSLAAALAAVAWVVVLAVLVDWDNVGEFKVSIKGTSVESSHWQWIFSSPVLCFALSVFGIATAAVIIRESYKRPKCRTMMAVFLLLGIVGLVAITGPFGAWSFRSHSTHVAYGTVLDAAGCKDDFPTTCGNKNDSNPNWVRYKYREAHTAHMGLGITCILLEVISLVIATLVFMLPLEEEPEPMRDMGPMGPRGRPMGPPPHMGGRPGPMGPMRNGPPPPGQAYSGGPPRPAGPPGMYR